MSLPSERTFSNSFDQKLCKAFSAQWHLTFNHDFLNSDYIEHFKIQKQVLSFKPAETAQNLVVEFQLKEMCPMVLKFLKTFNFKAQSGFL